MSQFKSDFLNVLSERGFVHQISDPSVAPTALVEDPFDRARRALDQAEPLPALRTGHRLFDDRANSRGIDVQHAGTLLHFFDRADAPPPTSDPSPTTTPCEMRPSTMEAPSVPALKFTKPSCMTVVPGARCAPRRTRSASATRTPEGTT